MAWAFDEPTGTFQDHALSQKVRMEELPRMRFFPYLRPETGFGRARGQSITITRFQLLPLGGMVSETERLPSGQPTRSTVSITTGTWGYKVELTERDRSLTYFPLDPQIEKLLRGQYRMTMDWMAATAMKTTLIKYTPLVAGGEIVTDGTPDSQADKNLGVNDVRNIYDELSDTLKAPPWANGRFVGIVSSKAARGVKSDPEFKDWMAPTTSAPFRQGTNQGGPFATIEGIDLYESNHRNALSGTLGANGVLGEAIFFGDDFAASAVVQDPQIRMGQPTDLGRFQEIGWVGELNAGLVWPEASLSRGVHVYSLDT